MNQFHGQEVLVALASHFHDVGDVGVLEQGRDAGLVEEHLDEFARVRQVRQDALDHHRRLESGQLSVRGQVHLGHATDGNSFDDVVTAEQHAAAQLADGRRQNLGGFIPIRLVDSAFVAGAHSAPRESRHKA